MSETPWIPGAYRIGNAYQLAEGRAVRPHRFDPYRDEIETRLSTGGQTRKQVARWLRDFGLEAKESDLVRYCASRGILISWAEVRARHEATRQPSLYVTLVGSVADPEGTRFVVRIEDDL